MTTITIDRALLEQALNALLLPCDRWNKQQFLIVKGAIESLNAALAAPATAPAWHDAPTVPGLWMCNYGDLSVATVNQPDIDTFDPAYNTGGRWYGPIPEDRQ